MPTTIYPSDGATRRESSPLIFLSREATNAFRRHCLATGLKVIFARTGEPGRLATMLVAPPRSPAAARPVPAAS